MNWYFIHSRWKPSPQRLRRGEVLPLIDGTHTDPDETYCAPSPASSLLVASCGGALRLLSATAMFPVEA